jgi:hypothetical protein
MKKRLFAAGALLLGTSALAWAPSTPPAAPGVKAPLAAKSAGLKAAAPTLVAKSNDLPKASAVADAADWVAKDDIAPASASWLADDGVSEQAVDTSQGDPDLDLTERPEPMLAAAAATPQPAAGNYPACRPGPGDDNCIQLYEPGVRTALASWDRPTGGMAGDTRMASAAADPTLAAEMGEATETGVGGPYEPVDASADLAMAGDGYVSEALGETDESEL